MRLGTAVADRTLQQAVSLGRTLPDHYTKRARREKRGRALKSILRDQLPR